MGKMGISGGHETAGKKSTAGNGDTRLENVVFLGSFSVGDPTGEICGANKKGYASESWERRTELYGHP